LDRLIVTLHPKYKRKAAKLKAAKAKANGTDNKAVSSLDIDIKSRKFPGLAMPDSEWRPLDDYLDEREGKEPVVEKLPESISMDSTMAELEAVASRRNRPAAEDYIDGEPANKRSRNGGGGYERDNGYGGRNGGGREMDSGYGAKLGGQRGRPGADVMDERPVLYKIYSGNVTNVRDFGAFVGLEGIRGRVEGELVPALRVDNLLTFSGLIHVSNLSGQRVNSAADVIKRNERVKVKVMTIAGTKIGLSLKDVDQRTGADLS
jgi:ATP-dependent RNA helicase DHX8/PRP22